MVYATSYHHAIPCCLLTKHNKCTLKGPMNGSYILAHARLLNMRGPLKLNLSRASGMLRPALAIAKETKQTAVNFFIAWIPTPF